MSQEIFGFDASHFIITIDVSYNPNCMMQLISKSSLQQQQSRLPQRRLCKSNFYETVMWGLEYHKRQLRAGVQAADYSNSASSYTRVL
jgi:hypothetical protein